MRRYKIINFFHCAIDSAGNTDQNEDSANHNHPEIEAVT